MVSYDEHSDIEAEFLHSWDGIENSYNSEIFAMRWKWMTNIRPFIRTLRERGYDRQLRAGQSMFTFIVSRSREYGLRRDQPFLAFDMLEQGGMAVTFVAQNVFVPLVLPRADVTPELEPLLTALLAYPVD